MANVETIRTIQAQLSGRGPAFVQQGDATISAPNGVPSGVADGVSVLDATNQPAVVTEVVIIPDTATAFDVRFWGYHATLGTWTLLEGGSYSLTVAWSQRLLTGSLSRLYVEVTATDGDLDVHIGPCAGSQ